MRPPVGFTFMFPNGMPWNQPQQEAPTSTQPDNLVPSRVYQAMELLQHFANIRMTRAAVTEATIEKLEGQTLTDEESTALATACNLLSKYFAGKLTPDPWETLRYTAIKNSILAQANPTPIPGTLMPCIQCSNLPRPVPQCQFCRGTGHIVIFAVANPHGPTPAPHPIPTPSEFPDTPPPLDPNEAPSLDLESEADSNPQ